jgi:hypothetical protein
MSLIDNPCAWIFGGGYLAFIICGVILKIALGQYTHEVNPPLTEDAIPTAKGKRLFQWDRAWRKLDVPMLIGVVLLYWLLCPARWR